MNIAREGFTFLYLLHIIILSRWILGSDSEKEKAFQSIIIYLFIHFFCFELGHKEHLKWFWEGFKMCYTIFVLLK